jgi:hypothetical protein
VVVDERVFVEAFEQREREGTRGLRLAYRNAVEPDNRTPTRLDQRKRAQTLPQALDILSMTKCVVNESRHQRDDAEGEQEAVKKIHK